MVASRKISFLALGRKRRLKRGLRGVVLRIAMLQRKPNSQRSMFVMPRRVRWLERNGVGQSLR